MEPKQFDFDGRPSPPIQFMRSGPNLNLNDQGILVGNGAQLKKGDVQIMTRVVEAHDDDRFVGEITGFESRDAPDFEGLSVGDRVAFTLAQVWLCTKP